jgi:pimeloyl-ACP methyl ester carboxylesterase
MVATRARQLACFLVLLLAVASFAPGRVRAQAASVQGTDRWQTYGAEAARGRDLAIPGDGAVTVQPPAGPGEPWSSGAVMTVPGAITVGERVTALFWARAARPTQVTVALQGGKPGYARFAMAEVTLNNEWQQFRIGGTAPAFLAAGSQSLTVPLGRAEAAVTLGPVAFFRGDPDRRAIARAFAEFRPAAVALDVRFGSDPGVVLAGTLHVPAGRGIGPFPIAVMIQGHGPNGRGGYTEVIKRLTADGIAALEYDKRGVGQSGGVYKEDLQRLTADAAAAVAAVRRRPEIDGARVALVGHSQGGVVAPAVAAADPKIAAVVTLAGSVGDGLPYLRRALLNQMTKAGRSEAASAPAVDAAINLLQARSEAKDPATIASLRAAVVDRFETAGFPRAQAEGALAMIDVEEAHRADRLRSASDLRALRVPVLAVFASEDPLVVAAHEAPAARAALVDNSRAKVVVLDGLSHWFQEGVKTGGAEEVALLGPNLGSPRIVTLVGDWLRDALMPK